MSGDDREGGARMMVSVNWKLSCQTMISWFVAAVVLLIAAYTTYLLFFNLDPEQETKLEDFLRSNETNTEDGDNSERVDPLAKYRTKYDEPGKQLLIFYASEYGFSEEVARKFFDRIADDETYQELSLQPRVVNAKDFEMLDFTKEQVALCLFSTTGDGVPPTNSRAFFDLLSSEHAPSLSHMHYSVLALGDYNYPHFCRTGKTLDLRLGELGAMCLHSRVDVDLEDWPVINKWMDGVLDEITKLELTTNSDYLDLSNQTEDTGYSRTKPFTSTMKVKYFLTEMETPLDKETIHAEFDLTESEITYSCGDALGIYPMNNLPEVNSLIDALHATADLLVPVPQFCYSPKPERDKMPLQEALTKYYDLKQIKLDLVKLLVECVVDKTQKQRGNTLLKGGLSKQNKVLAEYLSERELVDVLLDFSSFQCDIMNILTQIRPLQPRYYSIASSFNKDSNSVAVCAAVVRYSLQGKSRTGVCTTYIQDRMNVSETCPVFISENPDFRLPKTGDVPIIMIGPGTGIAPFRAFIQERVLTEAKGKNLLYFGCRNKAKDFLYKDELQHWVCDGVLELRTAFSRDQARKIYVQDLIVKDAKTIWNLLQEGAHTYVCGDALHMAGDVHDAMLKLITTEGGLTFQQAEEYMDILEKTSRYQRDVWVT